MPQAEIDPLSPRRKGKQTTQKNAAHTIKVKVRDKTWSLKQTALVPCQLIIYCSHFSSNYGNCFPHGAFIRPLLGYPLRILDNWCHVLLLLLRHLCRLDSWCRTTCRYLALGWRESMKEFNYSSVLFENILTWNRRREKGKSSAVRGVVRRADDHPCEQWPF